MPHLPQLNPSNIPQRANPFTRCGCVSRASKRRRGIVASGSLSYAPYWQAESRSRKCFMIRSMAYPQVAR